VTKGSKNGVLAIQKQSEIYPDSLRELRDAPNVLYLRGDSTLLSWEPKIAVIGSRDPTDYGVRVAQAIAHELARAGVCVVSGMARGIDGISHQAALDANGKTIAVLGTAIDELAPKSNLSLGLDIVGRGLVISEYAPKTHLRNWNFTARNRLISGLSRAVVIVEAAEQSGTLGTAKWALDQGREVFAVPGPVDSEKSIGTLQLLRDGARCVRSGADILADLGLETLPQLSIDPVTAYNHDENQDPILKYLGSGPIHMDILLEKSGLNPSELSQVLLKLEIAGSVRKLPGQRYVRCI
jgi:DNA processing protein